MSSSTGRTCMRRRVMPMVLAGSDGSSTSTCGGLNPSLHVNVATAFYGCCFFAMRPRAKIRESKAASSYTNVATFLRQVYFPHCSSTTHVPVGEAWTQNADRNHAARPRRLPRAGQEILFLLAQPRSGVTCPNSQRVHCIMK